MREEFRADLLEIGRLLVSMGEAVRTAMRLATTALLRADREAALAVISRDDEVDELYHRIEELVYAVLARQAPVASDLRLTVTSLHVATDLERMGDLAGHVAKTALRRYPACAVPAELRDVIGEMAERADRIAGKITLVLSGPTVSVASSLEHDDDAVDELQRQLFGTLLDDHWTHGVEAAVDAALLGRYYERYADHAVNAGQHVVYLITGEALGG
ncbi:phosphate signaling complex protein PhoU [Rhizomonospora bruguierae]|uniref:phosphate signaling complex protein PhoU n=1 Tax=Rhizomonospora bruguierae TaxID=1581705 RepID=UPI001BD04CEE|nr:phosphate signaling complex protein PhoU [Micromonospora sp. NBRC 107566]